MNPFIKPVLLLFSSMVLCGALPLASQAASAVVHIADEPKGIRFEKLSLEELKAIAKRENKLIFIDAYTTWCGPCKEMDRSVFPDAIVAKFYNDRFINAKFDMEKGEGLEIARKYEVRAYPSFLFIAADGELVHKAVGGREPAAFVMLGEAALDPYDRITTWQKRFKDGERGADFVRNYFMKLEDAGLDGKADYKTYLGFTPLDSIATTFGWALFSNHADLSMKREVDWVLANQQLITKQVPDAELEKTILRFYEQPLKRAFALDPKGADYKRLSAEVNNLGWELAKELITILPVMVSAGPSEPIAFGKGVQNFFAKHPKTKNHGLLNELAWACYESVDDPKVLATATKMSQRALEVNPGNYAYEDTYASLLFKRKLYKEALTAATKAIETGLAKGYDVEETQALLQKIKAGMKGR